MYNTLSKNPILWTDGYKLCHKDQYPALTTWVYETWTPRMSRIKGINHVVFWGLQSALAEMTQSFDTYFFAKSENEVIQEYEEAIREYLPIPIHILQKHMIHHTYELCIDWVICLSKSKLYLKVL